LLSDGKEQNYRKQPNTNTQPDSPYVNIQAILKNQPATKNKPSYTAPTILFKNGKATTLTGKWG
jgi:hypothetical protein